MANKPTKPVHQAKVFTPEQIQEQKRNQALQMLMQRREQFAFNILVSICRGNAYSLIGNESKDEEKLVDLSVAMADRLLEKLYPIKEDKQ